MPPICSTPTAEDRDGRNWTYLPYGPFAALARIPPRGSRPPAPTGPPVPRDPRSASGKAVGVAAYINAQPAVGAIEVGGIVFARAAAPPAATEAMYLMMRRVFDELGYRRYEWKCDR